MRFHCFILAAALGLAPMAGACAMFTLINGDTVYFANNEDFYKEGLIWFVPAGKERYARVNVGFERDFAQGSMNEKGLVFDAAVVHEIPWEPDPSLDTPKNLIEEIMDTCATVEEALRMFETKNCRHLAASQFMFADPSGDAAIVAWLPDAGLNVIRIENERLLMTNTRLELSQFRCPRFVKATQLLDNASDYSADTARDVLNAIHQEGPGGFTSYSTIYDLTKRKIHVYNLANYDVVKTFDFDEEIAKRRRPVMKLSEIFGETSSVEAVTQTIRTFDTEVDVAPSLLEEYAGRYQPEGMDLVLVVELADGALQMGQESDTKRAPLFPESEILFRFRDGLGQARFERDDAGAVVGVHVFRGGDGYAKRLSD